MPFHLNSQSSARQPHCRDALLAVAAKGFGSRAARCARISRVSRSNTCHTGYQPYCLVVPGTAEVMGPIAIQRAMDTFYLDSPERRALTNAAAAANSAAASSIPFPGHQVAPYGPPPRGPVAVGLAPVAPCSEGQLSAAFAAIK